MPLNTEQARGSVGLQMILDVVSPYQLHVITEMMLGIDLAVANKP